MAKEKSILDKDRFFSPEPAVRKPARKLYESVKSLPIVSPHGHIDPSLFSDKNGTFGDPTELLVIPDHYLYRMLYSQGVSLEELGIARIDKGGAEKNHRKIWKIVSENFYLFRATPTGMWLAQELAEVFGIKKKLSAETGMAIYDEIYEKLKQPEWAPRALFERFNIEVLCTTDAATDTLKSHKAIKDSGWKGNIRPSFRPDALVNNIATSEWKKNIKLLSEVSGIDIHDYNSYIKAIRQRREYFKTMGAASTDSAVLTPYTEELPHTETEKIFQNGLNENASEEDSAKFTAHMLMEMAGMSVEDGLVMQLHPGSLRDHNEIIFKKFGRDKGCDIPIQVDFTRGLKNLLNKYGNNPKLTLIVFTLDEDTYSRELAPLAGHYPALKLGPPWWFLDSPNGIKRYLERVSETAGIYNLAGFNDDTRAFPSIPARHDVWRRCASDWLAGLAARHIIDIKDAKEMILELAYRLSKKTYKL